MTQKVHLLNVYYTRLWYFKKSRMPWGGPERRPEVAMMIARAYNNETVAVADALLRVVALVKSGGKVEALPKPYKRIAMAECANAPSADECFCFDMYEPRLKGPWRDSAEAKRGKHHPICQFERECFTNLTLQKRGGLFTG